jgi:hypothetical protein
MKSKDQQMLEEAYLKVSEGKYTDNYGRMKFKSKSSPLSDSDDSARKKLQNDERNAGLEDDHAADESPTPTAPSPTPRQAVPASRPVTIDPSLLAGKKIEAVMWDYPDYVVAVDGKPVGMMFSKNEKDSLISALNDIENNKDNPLVQQWYKSASNDLIK